MSDDGDWTSDDIDLLSQAADGSIEFRLAAMQIRELRRNERRTAALEEATARLTDAVQAQQAATETISDAVTTLAERPTIGTLAMRLATQVVGGDNGRRIAGAISLLVAAALGAGALWLSGAATASISPQGGLTTPHEEARIVP